MSIPLLPETAPFAPAQRAWLNGFFAGMVTGHTAAVAAPVAQPGAVTAPAAPAPAPAADEDFPWHDSALSLAERLKLAEGKPQDRVLMAAMAQLDCGACGYLCKTYAEAIARGEEKDLTKCAPGGKDTARKLKELAAAGAGASPVVPPTEGRAKGAPALAAAPPGAPAARPANGYGRQNPFPARLLKCAPLNKAGSHKDTRFVAFDLKGSGLNYKAGDSLGVVPQNCPDMVGWILELLGASGAEEVTAPDNTQVSFHEALLRHFAIGKPNDLMLELLINTSGDPEESGRLKGLLSGNVSAESDEIIDLLQQYPSARPTPEEFVGALLPIQPRLYSISSSPKAHPDEVHLTVSVVRYLSKRGRQCKGVASTFMAERMRPGQKCRVFVQPSHGFVVPENGDTPIIMVGPGTGIAPFRAFLEERKAAGARGKNWLFFGDQRRDYDFLYQDELELFRREGFLTRFDTAFSRDQGEKVYVQQRMLENGAELWRWLQEGACFYVCGDAKRMANDVDQALKAIAAEHGSMTPEQAKAHVTGLAKSKRYLRDVY